MTSKLSQGIQAQKYIDGLVQERRNSSANALQLCLSCTNSSIWNPTYAAVSQDLLYASEGSSSLGCTASKQARKIGSGHYTDPLWWNSINN